jgi:hypothetical protein
VSGGLLALKLRDFGDSGERWLVQLKPDPFGGKALFRVFSLQ